MESFSDSTGIKIAVESLIGGRQDNQDSFGIAETRLGLLVVVCDGMGGGPAGKTASELATDTIINYVTHADVKGHKGSILADAVVEANNSVLAAVSANPALHGMGTTCVCLLIDDSKIYVAHVGDSRFYQLRGNRAVFRTADHSYVGEMVRRGTLTEEEARTSQHSNVITRAIGGTVTVDPEIDTLDYKPGDRFALMTDGIWGAVPEQQLMKFLTMRGNPSELVAHISENIDSLGKDNGGGHDNLTLAIVDIPETGQLKKAPVATNETEEAELPPYKKNTEAEKTKEKEEKKSFPIFPMTAGLVILAGIIIWVCLIAGKGDNEPPEELTEKKIEQVTEPQQPTPTEEEKPAPAQTSGKAMASEASKIIKVGDRIKFQEAVDLLDSLKNFNPQGKDFGQRKSERGKICNEIISCVEIGLQSMAEGGEKEKAKEVLEGLKADKSKLVQLDSKQLKSTLESIQTIDLYSNQLQQLVNKGSK